MEKKSKITLLLQLLIIFVWGLISIIWSLHGEIIGINNGLGYDGKNYAQLAADYPTAIRKATDTKYFQRSGPSAVVYGLLRATGLESGDRNIILVFACFNLLMLLLGVYAWNRSCNVSGLGHLAVWLGFTALFLNFAALKFTFFYPVLTDTAGFALSLWLLYAFCSNNKPVMLLIIVLSALSWPAIEYMCLVLLAFNNNPLERSEPSRRLNTVLALGISLVFVLLAGYLIHRHPHMRGGWAEHTYIIKNWIIPTLIATFIALFLSLRYLFNSFRLLTIRVFKAVDLKYAIAAVVVFAGTDFVIKTLAKNYGIHSGYSLRMYFNDMLIIGSRQPFCFWVGHIAYFGPLLLFCFFRWKQMCSIAGDYGWSLFLLLVQFVFFMMDSESRHILNYMPFIVFLLVKTFDRQLQPGFVIGCSVLSFLFSKAMLSMYNFPTSSWSENYNVNFGCYLTDTAYGIQLAVFAVTGCAFYMLLKKQKSLILT